MIRTLLLLLSLLASLPALAGPPIYIDCSAPSNGTGTFASPFWGVSSGTPDFNNNNNLNWTTIASNRNRVLFRAGVTCTNARLGLGSGFPTGLNMAGAANDNIAIGVYDPNTGAEILTPTSAQRPRFVGDGTTRTEMISLFGVSHFTVNGIDLSGGSFSSGRGQLAIGNGVAASNNVTISNCRFSQGATPTSSLNSYGMTVSGLDTAGGDQAIRIINNEFEPMIGTGGAYSVLVSNADGVSILNNTMRATAQGTVQTGHVLAVTTTNNGHFAVDRLTIEGNTMTGGRESIRHAPFGGTSAPMTITNVAVRNNTISELTHHAMRFSLPKGGVVEGNRIFNIGTVGGYQASALFYSGGGLFVGADDLDSFTVRNNVITNTGTFGVWVVGVNDFVIEKNFISGCGNPNVPGSFSFGRCIELTRSDAGGVTRLPAVTATLSGATGSVTLTATGALVAADLNRLVLAPRENAGICKITSVTAPNTATCDVLLPFSVTTLPSGDWAIGQLTHGGVVRGNTIREAFGRQYSASQGSEGIGIGLDDLTSLMLVEGNDIADTDYIGIEVNNGRGNIVRSNVIARAGRDNSFGGAGFIRRAGIIDKGAGQNSYFNNTINCARFAYGITAENTVTGGTDDIASGGIIEVRNNVLINCSQAGLLLNANDLASNNSFFGNAANYSHMAYLSFSSDPVPANITAQTLDGASIVADPQLVGGASPNSPEGFMPRASSPLCGAGLWLGKMYGQTGRRVIPPASIGAYRCGSGRTPAATRPIAQSRAASR